MRNLKDVFVDWISLVSKNEMPAVEQAESKFALFKTVSSPKNSVTEIVVNLNKKELKEIQENLKKRHWTEQ